MLGYILGALSSILRAMLAQEPMWPFLWCVEKNIGDGQKTQVLGYPLPVDQSTDTLGRIISIFESKRIIKSTTKKRNRKHI